MERIDGIAARLENVERAIPEMSKLWIKTVDDIRIIIKQEIGDLKTEQIGDLKKSVEKRDFQMDALEARVRANEVAIHEWVASSNTLNWLLKSIIAIGALLVGYFGGRHLP